MRSDNAEKYFGRIYASTTIIIYKELTMQEYTSKYFIIKNKADFSYDENIIKNLFDNILENHIQALEIDISDWQKVPIIFIEKGLGSGVSGDVITLSPHKVGNGYSSLDWVELLFSHELTHELLERYWGSPSPVIFWEGIPIYFADNKVRLRLFGKSYHQYCNIFLKNNLLFPINKILLSHIYYAKRYDYRIDVQAGSFAGFLLEKYGNEKMRNIFQNYIPPTPENPIMNINSLLYDSYEKNLNELEKEWYSFLIENVSEENELE